MPGDFGEFTVNIGLGINFLAGGTLSFNSNDTLSYAVVTLFILDFDDVSIQKYGPLIIVMIIIKFVNG